MLKKLMHVRNFARPGQACTLLPYYIDSSAVCVVAPYTTDYRRKAMYDEARIPAPESEIDGAVICITVVGGTAIIIDKPFTETNVQELMTFLGQKGIPGNLITKRG